MCINHGILHICISPVKNVHFVCEISAVFWFLLTESYSKFDSGCPSPSSLMYMPVWQSGYQTFIKYVLFECLMDIVAVIFSR